MASRGHHGNSAEIIVGVEEVGQGAVNEAFIGKAGIAGSSVKVHKLEEAELNLFGFGRLFLLLD